ncbi:MAG: alpha/beta hydrolase [Cyanothece sp. SIO1E1]|nr:alpha/beta hydrolase [Cyanothece sp. SIO1E1]
MIKNLEQEDQNPIAYRVSGKGFPLVLIHAGGLDQQMWEQQVKTFSKNYKVITYDVRGHGKSQNTQDRLLEIDDLKAVLAKEGVTDFHLVGLSFGAIIALDYVINEPGQVQKLVLASPGLVGFQEKNAEFLGIMSKYVAAIQAGKTEEVVDYLVRLNALGTKTELPQALNSYVRTAVTQYVKQANHLRIPKLKTLDPLSQLQSLSLSALVLYGEKDFDFIKANAKVLDEKLPQSQLQMIPDAAHLINMEQAALFNEKVLAFLNGM